VKIEELEQSEEFSKDKIQECLIELEKVFQKHTLNVGELILTYGNLGYKLGQNISKEVFNRTLPDPPNIDELQKLYYSNPAIDISLMLSALNMITWIDDLSKKTEEKSPL